MKGGHEADSTRLCQAGRSKAQPKQKHRALYWWSRIGTVLQTANGLHLERDLKPQQGVWINENPTVHPSCFCFPEAAVLLLHKRAEEVPDVLHILRPF